VFGVPRPSGLGGLITEADDSDSFGPIGVKPVALEAVHGGDEFLHAPGHDPVLFVYAGP